MSVDLEQLKRLASEATPGPWRECGHDRKEGCPCGLVWSLPADGCVAKSMTYDENEGEGFIPAQALKNCRYLAAANPAVILELIDRIEKLEASHEC